VNSIYGIPIIGTVSTAGELVATLKAAHYERLVRAEHDVAEQYVVSEKATA